MRHGNYFSRGGWGMEGEQRVVKAKLVPRQISSQFLYHRIMMNSGQIFLTFLAVIRSQKIPRNYLVLNVLHN